MTFPTGLTVSLCGGSVDNSPRVAVKDCWRRVATAPGVMPDAERVIAETIERAQVECFSILPGSRYQVAAHRVAADRLRVRMIERLQASHQAPYERDPSPEYDDADEPVRSRLFGAIESQYVHPIDAVAARVAGDDL